MKNWWRWAALLAAWWMVVFLVQRTLFLLFAWRKLADVPFTDLLRCNLHALPIDLSTTGYVMLLSSLPMIPLLFSGAMRSRRAVIVLSFLVLLVSAVINGSDIGLFNAWGTRLDRKAMSYLAYPEEAVGSISFRWLALLVGVVVAQVLILWWLFRRIDHQRPCTAGPLPARITSAVVLPVLCVIALRGGVQDDPINKSWSWFSRHAALNLAALNGLWNALEIAVEPAQVNENPYAAMPSAEAERLFTAQHPKGRRAAPSILKMDRPNVLVILLESWSADVIAPLGGDSGVAPAFSRLCEDGLLFSNFYSTGFRTEQGLCALVSSFPAQPKTTIMRNYGKFDRLPSVVSSLASAGYSSTYWYGGNVEFANTRAYLEAMGFDRIVDDRAFPNAPHTEWGAFDEVLFRHYAQKVPEEKQPFFHILMTSTSHEPFDAPVNEGFPGKNEPQRYRNTVHYTDRCMGAFLDSARSAGWYAHTLLIIVADHGHYLPRYRDARSATRHRIPFLLTGGALKDELRGTRDSTYGSHLDLAATLLGQLQLPHDAFEWSRDLFDQSVPHDAFWTFNEGFGMADSVQAIAFDEVGDQVVELRDSARVADRDRLVHNGQARLQVLLDRYIGFNQ